MPLTRQQRSIAWMLVLLLGALAPAAFATTILSGNLYFTTLQNQGGRNLPLTPNVWNIPFVYDVRPDCVWARLALSRHARPEILYRPPLRL